MDEPIWSEGARAALQAIDRGDRAVFVIGRAGTGKTTLVYGLQKRRARQVVLAPTGLAALNAGGQTIHSFFGLPPRMLNLDEIKPSRQRRGLMRRLERVVIDEISMVRADLLDAVDHALRVNRDCDEPFGGVQVVFVGDFCQLPPIVPKKEWEPLAQLGYRMPYALGARVFERLQPTWVELSAVYRQADPRFLDLLGSVRTGDRLEEAVAELNRICFRPHHHDRVPVVLTPSNRRAADYNDQGLASLSGQPKTFSGRLDGKFHSDDGRLPAPEELRLKPAARVMAVANDPQRRWVNGSLGTVVAVDDGAVTVRFDAGAGAVPVRPFTWEKLDYRWDDAAGRIVANVVGTYRQIPLVPAWAITIHKAQGLTLDDVRIDFDAGAFATGQAYVALSRVRTLDGLSFARLLRASDVKLDRNLAAFLSSWRMASGARGSARG